MFIYPAATGGGCLHLSGCSFPKRGCILKDAGTQVWREEYLLWFSFVLEKAMYGP